MTRPRVLHFIDSLDSSGGAEQQLVSNLDHFDHSCLDHSLALIRQVPHSREQHLPHNMKPTVLFEAHEAVTRIETFRRLKRLVHELHPQLIHSSLPAASHATRLLVRKETLRTIESMVNISHELIRTVDNPVVTATKLRMHRAFDRITLRNISQFHAISRTVAESWHRVVGVPLERTTTIPRARNEDIPPLDSTSRAEYRRSVIDEFGLPPSSAILLSIGRIEPQKGHRYLADAVYHLLPEFPRIHAIIVGRDGLASPALTKLINERSLQDSIILAGPRLDIPRLLAAADVFVFPSLFEGYGVALLEARLHGLPIVTTTAHGPSEQITHLKSGLLVPPCDSRALAQAIALLLQDSRLQSRLSQEAARTAYGAPTANEIASTFEDWYLQVLSQN